MYPLPQINKLCPITNYRVERYKKLILERFPDAIFVSHLDPNSFFPVCKIRIGGLSFPSYISLAEDLGIDCSTELANVSIQEIEEILAKQEFTLWDI